GLSVHRRALQQHRQSRRPDVRVGRPRGLFPVQVDSTTLLSDANDTATAWSCTLRFRMQACFSYNVLDKFTFVWAHWFHMLSIAGFFDPSNSFACLLAQVFSTLLPVVGNVQNQP